MKNQTPLLRLRHILLLGGLPLAAQAAPFLGTTYEPFDYGAAVDAGNPTSDSNLNANNRGTGWNATGDPALPNTTVWGGGVTTAPLVVVTTNVLAGNLVHPVPPVGNHIEISPSTAAGSAGRSFGQTVDSGTFYCSFTLQRLTDSIRTINVAFFAGATEKLGFGQYATATAGATSSGNLAAVFLNANPTNLIAGTPPAVPIPMGTGVPHQIIIRIDFNTSGVNDRVRIYVDPPSLADEAALTPYVDNANFDMTALTALRPFAGGSTTTPVALAAASAAFDELRLGSTFASVSTPLVPQLTIANQGGSVSVSWPSSFTWCFLQQHNDLTPAPWTTSEGIEDNGTTKSLFILTPTGRQFFRLARP